MGDGNRRGGGDDARQRDGSDRRRRAQPGRERDGGPTQILGEAALGGGLGARQDRTPCAGRGLLVGDALRERDAQLLHERPVEADLVATAAAAGEMIQVWRRAGAELAEPREPQQLSADALAPHRGTRTVAGVPTGSRRSTGSRGLSALSA